jgi:hypothetical protein
MKLQYIGAATLAFALVASKSRYPVNNQARQDAVDAITLPTKINGKEDVIALLTALSEKHSGDLMTIYNNQTADMQIVFEKIKEQVNQGQTQKQKVHNVKLVLINNHDKFNMTKPEMMKFIRKNKKNIDKLANGVNLKNIDDVLNSTVNESVDDIKQQLSDKVAGIKDDETREFAQDLLNNGQDFINKNQQIQDLLNENGDSSVKDVGKQVGDWVWQWVNDEYNINQKISDLQTDINTEIDNINA